MSSTENEPNDLGYDIRLIQNITQSARRTEKFVPTNRELAFQWVNKHERLIFLELND